MVYHEEAEAVGNYANMEKPSSLVEGFRAVEAVDGKRVERCKR